MEKEFKYLGEGEMKLGTRIIKKGDTIKIEVSEKKKFKHPLFKPVDGGSGNKEKTK